MHFTKKGFIAILMSVIMVCSPAMVASAYEAPANTAMGGLSARELSKQAAEEGMVLLKNDVPGGSQNSALPLADGESVAIFGINQIDFIQGGGGSGDSISEYYVNLYQGMKNKGDAGKITLYEGLYPAYETYYNNAWKTNISYAFGTRQGAVILEKGEMPLSNEEVSDAADAADTAIITIGRTAGENEDRDVGDFQLSEKETTLINQVIAQKDAGKFKKIIVILNVTGVMETNWFKDEPAIDAALMVYLPGMEGGNAMADVLCGDSYPSGKLVDTWANTYSDYPSSTNFGKSSYTNYEEDIFVGYRYFETIPDAAEKVSYEFGFGLSYADLVINNINVNVTGTGRERTVNVTAAVKNNSTAYSGKEVVQVYCEAPEIALSQPKKELVAFVKTNELAPGASETVTMSFPFDDLASYDDVGKTGHEAAYVLESGEYTFYVGNSVRNEAAAVSYRLGSLEVAEQLEHRLVPDTTLLTQRLTSTGDYEPLTQTTAADSTPEEAESRYTNFPAAEESSLTFNDVIQEVSKNPSLLNDENIDILTTFVGNIPDADLANLVGCVIPQLGRGHRTAIGINKYGIPKVGSSNGPASIQWNLDRESYNSSSPGPDSSRKQELQGDDTNKNSTLFPCATMQASTWNVDLMEQIGIAMGVEASFFGMSLWQAPGVNIHRDPLCGRNFEYFSEDPLITGKMASHITKGVQSQKYASQLKHFACNNQELGRWGNDSRVSERALREIYLKGYEIAVKEANPWSIMSSYNKINGVYGSANYELLTEILRNEWGWGGFVMSDFGTTPSHVSEVIAGGDVKARENSINPKGLTDALNDGTLQRWQLRRSAERVLKFLLRSEVGNDLALNKSVRTSYAEGSNAASNVNDGDDTTRWSAYNTSDRTNHWIEVDLGDVYNLERISMMPYAYSERIYQYEVWVKDTVDDGWAEKQENNSKSFDTLGYRKVAEGDTSTLIKNDIVLDNSIRARYVAIRIPGGSGADGSEISSLTASIYTLNIFGWKLGTEYVIDESNKTINVPSGLSAETLLKNVQLSGDNGLTLKVENGNTLTLQDCANNIKASYTIAGISNKHTVSLNPNGGKVSKSSVEVEHGQKVSTAGTLPAPTREGYVFKGWYTSAAGSTLAKDTVVMGDITIYAQWTPVTVKFTNKKDVTLNIGKTTKRTANVSPPNINVEYTTSNKNVATVNSNGKVTAKGAGAATITAKYGNKKDSYKVLVKPAKVKVTAKSKTGKKVNISWKKVTGATGYEIQAAKTKKGLSKAKPIKIKKASTLKYNLTKLEGKKLTGGKIYIRMRAYTKAAGYENPIYGDYCARKSCNVKK